MNSITPPTLLATAPEGAGGTITRGLRIFFGTLPATALPAAAVASVYTLMQQYLVVHVQGAGSPGFELLGSLVPIAVSLAGAAIVLRSMWRRAEPGRQLPPMRVGAFLLATLLVGLGIALGLVLLVLPGVLLTVAWCLYMYPIVGQGSGPIQALGDSFDAITRNLWTTVCVGLVLMLAIALLSTLAVAAVAFAPEEALALVVIGSETLLGTITMLVSLAMGLALYAHPATADDVATAHQHGVVGET